MNEQAILAFLHQYGYWLMIPLMIIEGPVVTMVAAMLASFGVFNPWLVLVFSIGGDLVSDFVWYWVGQRFGVGLVHRTGRYFGITPEFIERLKERFTHSSGRIVFMAKSTTGLCAVTFIVAGFTRMPFSRFTWYTFLGGLVWSGFLTAVGYFYGYLWREITDYISWIGWVVGIGAAATLIGIWIFQRLQAKKLNIHIGSRASLHV